MAEVQAVLLKEALDKFDEGCKSICCSTPNKEVKDKLLELKRTIQNEYVFSKLSVWELGILHKITNLEIEKLVNYYNK